MVTLGCGKFFQVTDQNNFTPTVINKDYVEIIIPASDGTARIVMRDIETGNPRSVIETVEQYSSLSPSILNCNDPPDGAQVLSLDNLTNFLSLSGGGGTVDLSPYLDNTDNQIVLDFSYDDALNELSLQIQNAGPASTVDLGDLEETITTLSDDGNGDFTYTSEDGTVTTITNEGSNSVVTNTVNGHRIATHNDGEGSLTDIDETETVVVDGINGNTVAVYENESGTRFNINETITSFVNNGDGTYTYTSEDGTETTTTANPSETITTLVDNGDNTYTYTNEDGTQTIINDTGGDLTANNALTKSGDNIKFGGPLLENTVVNASGFTQAWNNFPSFTVTNPLGDRLAVGTGEGARLEGTSGNYMGLQLTDLVIDGGDAGGRTYWRYGGTPISNGSFLQVVGSSAEVAYAPYTVPTNNIGAANYGLLSDVSGNLQWTDLNGLFTETITTLEDNSNGSFTYTSEDGTITTWNETTTTIVDNNDGSFTYTNEDGAQVTIGVISGGDNWGDGEFTFSGDIGQSQTVNQDENISFEGENLIQTEALNTNTLITRINTNGAENGDVIIFDGVSAVWNPVDLLENITTLVDNNNGSFTYTSEDGTVTTWSETTSTLTNNNDGTYTYTDEDGTITTILDGSTGSTSLITNTIVGNTIATHDDGFGNTVDINETVTTLTDNGDDTFTYTSEDGTQTSIDLNEGNTSVVTNTIDGQLIATHNDGAGNLVEIDETITQFIDTQAGSNIGTYVNETGATTEINETITTLVDNGDGTFTYTSEGGIETTISGAAETITTLVDNGDGTYTYTSEDGTVTTTDLGEGNTSIITNTITGHRIATHDDGTGQLANIDETITSFVDNGNGTYTYTAEDGSTFTTQELYGNNSIVTNTIAGNTIATHNDGNGVVTNIRESITQMTNIMGGQVIADYVNEQGTVYEIGETVTSFTDNGNGTYTYTSEDGTITTTNLGGGNTSSFNNVISGNAIAEHNDGTGNITTLRETITTLVDNGNGTYTYTSEDGTTTTTTQGSGSTSTVFNTIPGNRIASHSDGAGNTIDIDETITTFVDNGNGTYTYTSENGTSTTTAVGSGNTSAISNTVAGHRIATHNDGTGNNTDIRETNTSVSNTVPGNLIGRYNNESGTTYDISETITSLSISTNQLTYTDEAGVANDYNIAFWCCFYSDTM